MEYKRYKLGDLITQRREKYEGDNIPIAGISRDGFMPPKQIEADTSIYNVFYLNDFVFNPARMELNSIVFNDVYPKAICSSLYEMFYVHRTDVIMPEYLNLYVKRDEFARHCEFLGSGSAREYCRVGNISEIELDIPSIEEQQKIVRQYKTITDRIEVLEKINEELDKLAYTYFKSLFQKEKNNMENEIPDEWEMAKLEEFADFRYGTMAPTKIITETGYPIYSGYRVVGYCNKYMFEESQLVVLARGVSGTGEVRISPPKCHLTNLSIAVMLHDRTYMNYFYYYLANDNLRALDSGSAQSQITINDLAAYKVLKPPYEIVKAFDNFSKPILENIRINQKEIEGLKKLQLQLSLNI